MERSDVARLAPVLARAFMDDPIAMFMFRTEDRRRRSLRRFFVMQLKHMFIDRGEAWTTDDLSGAALWMPPGQPRPTIGDLRHMVPLVPAIVALGSRMGDAARLVGAIERARPRRTHWYLATLGTDPDRQGRGVGTTLVRRVLDRLDAGGIPAYLETSKPGNVAFYRRLGFGVTAEADPVPGGPHVWFMWRDPLPPSTVGDAHDA
ncbi:MAG: GNAT family N-acetyltransferase [Acidimicrobiales bacterium]